MLATLDSPRAVSHHLLLLCCSIIQSQLGHLTADVLEHGQKLGTGAEPLVDPLSLQEVRQHLCQLSVAHRAGILTGTRWRRVKGFIQVFENLPQISFSRSRSTNPLLIDYHVHVCDHNRHDHPY